jgi:exopolysaccharide biosynthesis polyprenyl glycosylphosphotransferase
VFLGDKALFRRFSTNFALFSMVLDAVWVAISLIIADRVRPELSSLPYTASISPNVHLPLLIYPLAAAVWVLVLMLLSVYDGRRNLRVTDELTSVTLGSIMAAVTLAGMLYLSFRSISRLLFIVFVIINYTFMFSWRLIYRLVFKLGAGTLVSNRRVLIIGAGPVGRQVEERIAGKPYMGLVIAGFLDDNPEKQQTCRDILGTLDAVRVVVKEQQIDDVVIALPRWAYEKVNQLVAELHNLPVKVWVVPDYFHLALHKAVIEEFADIPMLDLRAPALNDYQRMVKRAFDLIIGIPGTILGLPLMGLIALAIKIDSPGPAIFKQYRVGENGKLFWMYKFRSMVKDADQHMAEVMRQDENGNMIHKNPNDPRVTRVGRIIRHISFDELPNLFNVLRGEMSLVGPRPELPILVEQYEPWQCKRFAVPQGMTGWWQVNGRSDKPMHLHTEDDIFYVQNYSLLLDIKILLKTVWVALRGKGAY